MGTMGDDQRCHPVLDISVSSSSKRREVLLIEYCTIGVSSAIQVARLLLGISLGSNLRRGGRSDHLIWRYNK